MKLTREQICDIIPHRDPMLLIDAVEELTPGVRVTATFYVDPERDIFRGHFPGDPVLPGVYIVESMAQAADILLLSTPRYAGKIPLFLGIDKVRFRKKILPGDTMELRVTLLSERPEKAIAVCEAQVLRLGELAAEGQVSLAMR